MAGLFCCRFEHSALGLSDNVSGMLASDWNWYGAALSLHDDRQTTSATFDVWLVGHFVEGSLGVVDAGDDVVGRIVVELAEVEN